jgi:putative FmdB family regulatory protein
MPLYDFACRACGRVFEAMAPMNGGDQPCTCGGPAGRLVSVGRGYRADAAWLGSVAAVVEKDSDKPHVRAFLAEPSRANYRRWMAGEGLRPLEAGETRGTRRPDPGPGLGREVLERFKARRGLA